MVCRQEEKGKQAVQEVIKASGDSCCDVSMFRQDHSGPDDCGHLVLLPTHLLKQDLRRCAAGNQDVHLGLCDISSLESVRSFAAEHKRSGKPLHVLVNNAGMLVSPLAAAMPS
jgi:NAD(P)-dependent dehydrogenase (short-subunit alcohol dehydrogenase family)